MAKLPPKVERFVEEYLVSLNAADAYRKSHPGVAEGTARTEGCRLLAKPEVQEAIAAANAARSKRTQISQDRVIRELAKVAFLDIRRAFTAEDELKGIADMPASVAGAISAVDFKKGKVKFHSKTRALELLLRHLADANSDAAKSIELIIRDYTTDGDK